MLTNLLLQVPPLLAEAWARELRSAILTDYPELEDQFEDTKVRRSLDTGPKRKADELEDFSEGRRTKRSRES
jgi:hypothetical protein